MVELLEAIGHEVSGPGLISLSICQLAKIRYTRTISNNRSTEHPHCLFHTLKIRRVYSPLRSMLVVIRAQ